MLLLLNRELVMVEVMAWARHRVAEVLRVPLDSVQAEWRKNSSDYLVPNFDVRKSACPEVPSNTLQQVLRGVSGEMRAMLDERLKGLEQRRGSSAPDVAERPQVRDPRHRLVAGAPGPSGDVEED